MTAVTPRPTDAREKALAVNLDPRRYGTFAEIGAGQEVVRWFFRVGGAAGTIAKSMSAYDMKFSDEIYGPAPRYVARERLEAMLDYEQDLLRSRLDESRGHETAFFTFADTVSARNFRGTNECHGWLGISFQSHPRDADSRIIVHVRMLDQDASAQQEALGIVGVNLVFGACMLSHEPDELLSSLLDGLSRDRIEIDMIEFSGIEFRNVDNRVMSLRLVQSGYTGAAMFAGKGAVLQPSEVLRKRPILLERGHYRPVTRYHLEMMRAAREHIFEQDGIDPEEVLSVCEITMRQLLARGGEVDMQDFLSRADMLACTGHVVLVSDFAEYFRLAQYLRRYTQKPIRLVTSVVTLMELFDPRLSEHLDGGILESFGRLFKNDLKVLVAPRRDRASGRNRTLFDVQLPEPISLMFAYLVRTGSIDGLTNVAPEYMSIRATELIDAIARGSDAWENGVPEEVAQLIRTRRLLGYRGIPPA